MGTVELISPENENMSITVNMLQGANLECSNDCKAGTLMGCVQVSVLIQ